jgi:hypothetical protein
MPDQVTDTSGIADGDGHFLHDHPDIMSNPAAKNALAKYDSVGAAMLGGFNAMQTVGKPHINIPGDDADDTRKAEFKTAIAKHTGAITKVEDVKITRPDGSNETNYNEALEDAFKAMAVNENMNQSQVDKTYGLALEMINAINTRDTDKDAADIDASVLKLTADLGGADKLKEGMELKARLCETFFDADTAKLFSHRRIVSENGQDKQVNGTVFGNHAGLNAGLIAIANIMMKEGRSLKGSIPGGQKTGKGAFSYPKMEARKKAEKDGNL